MRRKEIAILLITMSIAALTGAPFKADSNTLLLAGFEEGYRQADYSLGWNKFAGSGAVLVEGYYGKGLDLRQSDFSMDKLKGDDYTAYYSGWGLYPDGNINYRQGTFECWVKVSTPDNRKFASGSFLNAFVTRTVQHAKGHYVGTRIGFNTYNINFLLPFLNGEYREERIIFRQVKGFNRALSSGWHHFALCWSPGEAAIYIDGRVVSAWDMTGKHGLAIVSNPVRYLQMADCVIDELRISDIVRYPKDFEPRWRDGKRPVDAFTGVPDVKRFSRKIEDPFRLKHLSIQSVQQFSTIFNRRDGRISWRNQAFGLRLYSGLERKEIHPVMSVIENDKPENTEFTQKFGTVLVRNKVHSLGSSSGCWEIELENKGDDEQWLEAILTMPVNFAVKQIFDGTEHRKDLRFQRYRDTYRCTLPLAAAASENEFMAVGLDPTWPYNDLITVFVPGKVPSIGQGTRVALSPGEKFTLRFIVAGGTGKFGTLEAIDFYHAKFPQLYRLDPEVTRYSYLPATQYLVSSSLINMQRAGFAGGLWGHGPAHTKGNEFGMEKFWNMEKYKDEKSYTHAAHMEKMWNSLKTLRECIYYDHKRAFDQAYPVRRFHYCPDQMPGWLVKELWPGYTTNDDPLCFGQYYIPIMGFYSINEYNTPLGKHIIDQTVKYFNHGMKDFSPGWINDMGTSGALFRFNDTIAQKTNGRSFSYDLGTFVRSPMGRQQRYEVINSLRSNGYKASIWSDGSWFSYTVQGYSSALAVEGALFFENLSGNGAALEYSRQTLGAKPITSMSDLNKVSLDHINDVTGDLKDPAKMREFLRYHFDQLMLYALEHGIQLDPGTYLWGKQNMLELQPLLIESTTFGRQLLSGGTVNEPLWLKRGGEGIDSVVLCGNYQSHPVQADITLYNQYYNGAVIPGNYYGGKCRSAITDSEAKFSVVIPPRRAAAWKILAKWNGQGAVNAESDFSGNGLTMRAELVIENNESGKLELNPFKPLYSIEAVQVNGQKVSAANKVVELTPGKNTVKISYRNQVLRFNAEEFDKVNLFNGKESNFKLIANKGRVHKAAIRTWLLGFERGTADLLAEFARQYDWEDGIRGNTKIPQYVAEYDSSYSGWQVLVDAKAENNGCTIKPEKRLITISGKTQGEARRSMVVFLRQLERKYPMLGGMIPLESRHGKYEYGAKINYEKVLKGKKTIELFENLNEPNFLLKPLFNVEYEYLYKDDDFTGKYTLRVSPFLFEPTYEDNFVYGYSGVGND